MCLSKKLSSWKRTVIYILPLLIMIFIFVQSALPADLSSEESGFFVDFICRFVKTDPEMVTFLVRKAAHASEYFALGLSLGAALFVRQREKEYTREKRYKRPEASRSISTLLTAGIIGIAYAVSDEIHQYFVPERSCELRDIVIDSVGVICGLLILNLIIRKAETGKTE